MNKINTQENLTFDDVLLCPQYSEVLPSDVSLSTNLTKRINLNIPFISAAMDTVTESEMAISIARLGGLGVIHKNLTPKQQALEVDKVKRSESGMILDPITISPTKKIKDAMNIMAQYKISGVPVVKKGKVVGILTNRDIRFETNLDLKVSDRMTKKNLISVSKKTSLDLAKKKLQEHRIEKLLVIDKGKLCGLITVKDILKKQNYPNASIDRYGRLLVGAAIGVSSDTIKRIEALKEVNVDLLFIDTAHAHTKIVISMIDKIKSKYPDLEIVVGNVATKEAFESLCKAGADAVKVGIGAGSICTTRIIAGVGVPQLSAVLDCKDASTKYGVPLISDGGMRYSGDIAKSLGAGSDSVMLGSMFAGADESPGEIVLWEGRTFKKYRGMGSIGAMKNGGGDRYFQFKNKKFVPEGIEGMVPQKGSLKDIIFQLSGGLKSSMGYCGAKNIKDFHSKAVFKKITKAGIVESHPHDVSITKESPNYKKPI
ncbi:MAG: IMP dehydrogenase [Candidatus Marinimicrobia bacterium]|nr:IMP dehydrogenase [Candidatus Neomarinimicrobiota bacterium]|tara:strand:+ start:884 stop:2338 length:1455 start_codon:yes stop_codon:yes gene_type:complete